MNDITCRLINAIPNELPLNRVLTRHRAQCLRCQADDARSVGVTRELSGLSGETLSAPDGLATTVMTRLGTQDGADPRRPLVIKLFVKWSAFSIVVLATVVAIAAGVVSRGRRNA